MYQKYITHCIRILFAAVLLAGCSPASVDTTEDLRSLEQAAIAYSSAASAKDAAAVMSMYDESVLMVPPNAEFVDGPQDLANHRFGFIETAGIQLEFELVRAEVSDAGDMGWTLAVGDITIPTETGTPDKDIVRDFHTWKKQSDGSWKVVIDMWNSGIIE